MMSFWKHLILTQEFYGTYYQQRSNGGKIVDLEKFKKLFSKEYPDISVLKRNDEWCSYKYITADGVEGVFSRDYHILFPEIDFSEEIIFDDSVSDLPSGLKPGTIIRHTDYGNVIFVSCYDHCIQFVAKSGALHVEMDVSKFKYREGLTFKHMWEEDEKRKTY